jgi:hypothetical protein
MSSVCTLNKTTKAMQILMDFCESFWFLSVGFKQRRLECVWSLALVWVWAASLSESAILEMRSTWIEPRIVYIRKRSIHDASCV